MGWRPPAKPARGGPEGPRRATPLADRPGIVRMSHIGSTPATAAPGCPEAPAKVRNGCVALKRRSLPAKLYSASPWWRSDTAVMTRRGPKIDCTTLPGRIDSMFLSEPSAIRTLEPAAKQLLL